MTADQDRLFCSKPFDYFEPGVGGDAFLCCPSWLPRSVGNVGKSSPEAVWNGKKAQEVRASILDGSFRFCSEHCPHLKSLDGPVQRVRDVTDPEHLEILANQTTVMPRGPRTLICSYDRSCNLSCPTCRPGIIQASKTERVRLGRMQDSLVEAFAKDLDVLYVTGSGDPFGSPLFFDLLKSLDPKVSPELRVFLHTNAQLFSEERWQQLANMHPMLDAIEVSIDAATEATYRINRAPGRWSRLLENLQLLARLRHDGGFRKLTTSFVVQQNNWREMPRFVEMARELKLDGCYFGELVQWWFPRRILGIPIGKSPVLDDADFAQRAVHLPGHPEHEEFVASLADPVFEPPYVSLGAMHDLRQQALAARAG